MSMNYKRGITLSELSSKASNKNVLDGVFAGVLKNVDACIITARDSGLNSVKVDLPVTFGIPTMKDHDISFYLQSELLNIMLLPENDGGKGFGPENVYLERTKHGVNIVIRWGVGLDPEEKEWRRQLIESYTRNK
jgi:hypothetical protein